MRASAQIERKQISEIFVSIRGEKQTADKHGVSCQTLLQTFRKLGIQNQIEAKTNGVAKMELKILLIAALLSTTLTCACQDQQPAAPAAPATAAPAATQTPTSTNNTTPSATAAPLAAGHLAESYVIGPDDQISINVWKEPPFSGAFAVRPDGMITVPLVGDMLAAGLTPTDLAAQITVKLHKFLQDPVVTVTVTAIKSKLIYLMGEVTKKGPMDMTPGMTVLQAIGMAGTTEYANLKKAYLLRDVNGVRTKIPIHYKEALKGNLQYDIPLKPGDTIVIP
jgi:polysaccharide export outer membrane protein